MFFCIYLKWNKNIKLDIQYRAVNTTDCIWWCLHKAHHGGVKCIQYSTCICTVHSYVQCMHMYYIYGSQIYQPKCMQKKVAHSLTNLLAIKMSCFCNSLGNISASELCFVSNSVYKIRGFSPRRRWTWYTRSSQAGGGTHQEIEYYMCIDKKYICLHTVW
jgi:hypothetical protein